MLIILELLIVIALSVVLVYLKREKVKMVVQKTTSHELFPKVFWGFVLGLLIVYFNWRENELFGGFYRVIKGINILGTNVRGLHFVGPLFGVLVGIIFGVSSKLFSVKKLLLCILAGLIGGLVYSTKILLSAAPNFTQSVEMGDLVIFVFTPIPFAICIADKSLSKLFSGLIGEGMGIVFFSTLLGAGAILSGGAIIGFGNPLGISHFWICVIFDLIVITSSMVTLMGMEISDFEDILKVGRRV